MKYIDAEKLIAEIERKRDSALERQKNLEKIGQETVLNEMIAFELNRLISFVASLQQEMELPEKYQTPDWLFEGQEQPVEGYNRAMLEVKAKIDKLYDETSIGLNEYDAGLYNGIAETCMKLRGFIKARISSPEQSVLPGIDEEGIPGKDFIPVEWVDACERYGKWKIVKAEQPSEGLEEELEKEIDDICSKAGIAIPYLDGNQWCILKGDNIQTGVVGFGNTKEDALANFIKDVPIPQNEPIPITPEILEKNGLRKLITYGTEKWVCDKFRLNVYDSGETWRFCAYTNKNEDSVIYIRYVYELQLALRVCGIEKEIMI